MASLGENQYGKSRVRLSRIMRREGRHDFQEWTVRVLLRGNFENSFTQADNSCILPTDTMKNTVYSRARDSSSETIEEFAIELGDYLLETNPQVRSVRVEISEKPWQRMIVDGVPEPTTFRLAGTELQTVCATRSRSEASSLSSGVEGLTVLKTTKSAFEGYIMDRLTTLKPTSDRILGTSAKAVWEFMSAKPRYALVRYAVISALMKEFAIHNSMSVQHTLFDMGRAALAAAPEISRITLTMPNLHHLQADLKPFGQDNPNHIFVPIDEPHGYIEATIER